MKVGIFTVLFSQRPFAETLDYVKQAGCQAVEIGCGAYPGDAHCRRRVSPRISSGAAKECGGRWRA